MKADYSLYLLLSKISSLSVAVPMVIGLYKRKYFNTSEKVLMVLTIVSFLTEIVCYIVPRNDTMYVYHVYTVIEFTFISFFFIKVISPSKVAIAMKIIIVLFVGVAVYDNMSNGRNSMDDLSTTTESILLILYSITAFFFLLKYPTQLSVFAIPMFWLNTAVLLYFSGNLFVFIFSNYMERHSHKVYYELWGIHSVMNIIFYLLISIGFWKTKAR